MATSNADAVVAVTDAPIQATATGLAIPALAKDLIAGTFGGWAQVVVGNMPPLLLFSTRLGY